MKNESLWDLIIDHARSIESTIVKHEASLSDEQIVMAGNVNRELFKILEAEQRKIDGLSLKW